MDPEALKPANELFKKLGLNQSGAQELMNIFAENATSLVQATEAAATEAWNELRTEWTKAIEADPDVGGAKLPETRAAVSKLFDAYGTPGLRDALKLTGADNNPDVFKFFAKVAKSLNEGKPIPATPSGRPQPKTAAEVMYPDGGNQNIGGRPAG